MPALCCSEATAPTLLPFADPSLLMALEEFTAESLRVRDFSGAVKSLLSPPLASCPPAAATPQQNSCVIWH